MTEEKKCCCAEHLEMTEHDTAWFNLPLGHGAIATPDGEKCMRMRCPACPVHGKVDVHQTVNVPLKDEHHFVDADKKDTPFTELETLLMGSCNNKRDELRRLKADLRGFREWLIDCRRYAMGGDPFEINPALDAVIREYDRRVLKKVK